jgi:hypothetical protein
MNNHVVDSTLITTNDPVRQRRDHRPFVSGLPGEELQAAPTGSSRQRK